MPFSTAIDNSILDHFTTKTTWTARSAGATFVGLSDAAPGKTGAGTSEPSGGAYARVQINAAAWDAAASSIADNTADVVFVTATATWLTGNTLTHMVLYSSVSGGTFLASKSITGGGKPVLDTDVAKFLAGELDLIMGGTA